MNNRKYLVISSLVLLLSAGAFIFLANAFSLTYEQDDKYGGPFSSIINGCKRLIKYLVFIPLLFTMPVWIIKLQRIHTYGVYKSAIKHNLYYSTILFTIHLLLAIPLFLVSKIIDFTIVAWSYVALFVTMSYLESTLAYKLYFY